ADGGPDSATHAPADDDASTETAAASEGAIMGIETTGKIHTVFETNQISERFSKREFVLELADNPKYPQLVLFQATGDRCEQLDGLQEGDEVRVEFSLRGREWRSPAGEIRYFNSLDVWKVEPVNARAAESKREKPPATTPPAD